MGTELLSPLGPEKCLGGQGLTGRVNSRPFRDACFIAVFRA